MNHKESKRSKLVTKNNCLNYNALHGHYSRKFRNIKRKGVLQTSPSSPFSPLPCSRNLPADEQNHLSESLLSHHSPGITRERHLHRCVVLSTPNGGHRCRRQNGAQGPRGGSEMEARNMQVANFSSLVRAPLLGKSSHLKGQTHTTTVAFL